MPFLYQSFGNRIYKCDGCGREGAWSDTWQVYGSIADEETCPHDMLVACSDECRKLVDQRLKTRQYKPPKIVKHGYGFVKTCERKGY